MDISAEQEKALRRTSAWLRDRGGPQVFRLFGYAGTGKTTLARHLASDVGGEVTFCAYTGKAAMVLRSKGCPDAQTIHSLIYVARSERGGERSFRLNRSSRAKRAKLIVVDECSMVGEGLGRDLLSFGTKVLVLGDPFQLAPMDGAGFFTNARPDVMLEEVHRQAKESAVIRLSMDVRGGRALTPGKFGESLVTRRSDLEERAVLDCDQLLLGSNGGRQKANIRIRKALGRRTSDPVVGDRLVCLRNDARRGLVNGGQYSVERLHGATNSEIHMRVVPADGGSAGSVDVSVHRGSLEGPVPGPGQRHHADTFEYGYALTVHKAQGSQWPSVALACDVGWLHGETRLRWLYTGITRASERVVVAL